MKEAYIAADFGGGSGRVIAGTIDDGRLTITEIHRFGNRQVRLGGHTYWDFPALFADMTEGLRKAVEAGFRIKSIGIDTWGVDFGFIDSRGNLLSNPICYRDDSITGSSGRYLAGKDIDTHYSMAGLQVMDINSLYRLADMKRNSPDILGAAHRLLFMPDLFSYFLTSADCNEYTIASTSGLIDARSRCWNNSLIAEAGLPEHLFGRIVMPGEVRGTLTDDVKRQIGIDYDVNVVAVGSHDTASAVYSVAHTYDTDGTAYLSSGTWSLLGVTLAEPILSPQARTGGFTNEGGIDGRIRFLQNITGLWILQSLMAEWRREGLPTDYGHLIAEAEKSGFTACIDVDDARFTNPHSMSEEIKEYFRERSAEAPHTQGDTVRCVLESLALRYKKGIDNLNNLLPEPVKRLQIIGGGSRNALLNRLTEKATGLPVSAGPAEATAIGNILLQARTDRKIASPADITEIIQT